MLDEFLWGRKLKYLQQRNFMCALRITDQTKRYSHVMWIIYDVYIRTGTKIIVVNFSGLTD